MYIYNIYIHKNKTHIHTHLRKKKNTYYISNRKAKQITFSITKRVLCLQFTKKHQLFHLPGLSSKNCGKGGITDPWFQQKNTRFYTHPIFHKTGPLGIRQLRISICFFKLLVLFFVLKPTSSEHFFFSGFLEHNNF